MNFGVVRFPGTSCEQDALYALEYMGYKAEYVWHENTDLHDIDALVLPGGSSYGDYVRPGAIARYSPIMEKVQEFAEGGKPVIGICNGFQILTEAGLLPGAFVRNKNTKFLCREAHFKVHESACQWLEAPADTLVRIPIAHHNGNFACSDEDHQQLLENAQVVLRYCEADGSVLPDSAPNGSRDNIAGICNKEGNVFGLMPHPERAVDGISGNTQGRIFFEAIARRFA